MGGLTVQHQALLRRQMRFHIIAVIDVIAALFGLVAGIISALYGLKYWALVIKILITAAITEMGVWIACGWRPSLPRLGAGAFSMIKFGAHITGYNILNYGSVNLANVLIGKFGGALARQPLGVQTYRMQAKRAETAKRQKNYHRNQPQPLILFTTHHSLFTIHHS